MVAKINEVGVVFVVFFVLFCGFFFSAIAKNKFHFFLQKCI